MFNSVALDVVIGLIFIYLLYSLLATTISEIIATGLGLRAKNLKRAIARMLEDDDNKSPGKSTNNKNEKPEGADTGKKETEVSINADSFYMQPLIKYLASGKTFTKPSYITSSTFSRTIINMLKKDRTDSKDLDKIKSALSSVVGTANKKYKDTETGQIIQSFLDEAGEDLQKFKLLLEQWFDSTMERTMGWYKRNVQVILLGIGLAIAIIFNASTTYLVGILAHDDKAREQMVQLASSYAENNPYQINTTGTVDSANVQELSDKLDSLLRIRKELMNDIHKANNILGTGWALPDSLTIIHRDKPVTDPEGKNLIHLKKINNKYLYASVPEGMDYKITGKTLLDKGELRKRVNIQDGFVNLLKWNYRFRYFIKNIIGYIITALAISLGAPFWFDLLNKVVQLRNSMKQPTSRQAGQTAVAKQEASGSNTKG